MRVLQVASEMFPLIKTGGLADVVGSLPTALIAEQVETAVLLPGYPGLLSQLEWQETETNIRLPGDLGTVSILKAAAQEDNVARFAVQADHWFNRPGPPYGPDARSSWPDNHMRFAVLAASAVALVKTVWQADIIHAHDWHAGLCGAYLKLDSEINIPLVFTIHNLAYQGIFDATILPDLGLPWDMFNLDGLEYYDQVSYMKGGINFADRVTTVSPGYASEIQTSEFGHGLEGLLAYRGDVLKGILNGVDYTLWNPQTDTEITQNFAANKLQDRCVNKVSLCEKFGLSSQSNPLVGVISRFTSQKGLDLLLDALPEAISAGINFVILGSGDEYLESGFSTIATQHSEQVGIFLGYDEALAHQIYAGADALLIPSRFEPCGLTQLYAMRYGALPVARRTGGLADTIIDLSEHANTGTGFLFDEQSPAELLQCLQRMQQTWHNTNQWRLSMQQAMSMDFGWDVAAKNYRALYQSLYLEIT